MTRSTPVVLSVAGSDPSGGAGIQGDLKTIHALGAYGAAVPTLLTVQNTRGVTRVELLDDDLVQAQLTSLLEDLSPGAAKTGALGSERVVEMMGAVMAATTFPWVVDPVWLPSRGTPLTEGDLVESYRDAILPRAALVTPNADEAGKLGGLRVESIDDARQAAEAIARLGARAVLIKGGHLEGAARGTDVLLVDGALTELHAAEVIPGSFHGTGCALSAAIATRLAFGDSIPIAVAASKAWLTEALRSAFAVGAHVPPVNHLWELADKP